MTRAQRQDAADDYIPDEPDDELDDSYDSSDACLVGGRLCYAGRVGPEETDDDPR